MDLNCPEGMFSRGTKHVVVVPAKLSIRFLEQKIKDGFVLYWTEERIGDGGFPEYVYTFTMRSRWYNLAELI